MNAQEVESVVLACARLLDLKNAKLGDEFYYQSLPFCIIDAVYSIGVRYESTKATVRRYCERFELEKYRSDKARTPQKEARESVEQLVTRIREKGSEAFAKEVFANLQRTSTKGGVLKAEAVLRFAEALLKHDVHCFQDIPKVLEDIRFEQEILRIPGQRSGISLAYFFMLAGDDERIKPDRMVLRFLGRALNREISKEEAQALLAAASETLRREYPLLTSRLLDYTIWTYQRSQTTTNPVQEQLRLMTPLRVQG